MLMPQLQDCSVSGKEGTKNQQARSKQAIDKEAAGAGSRGAGRLSHLSQSSSTCMAGMCMGELTSELKWGQGGHDREEFRAAGCKRTKGQDFTVSRMLMQVSPQQTSSAGQQSPSSACMPHRGQPS
jgi:hypothetical protein